MGNSTAGSAGAPKPMSGGHYARADGSIRPKDRGKYGHTHRPGRNAAVSFEDAQEDEPERAPSPPRRRVTRNVSPRTRRRLEREQGGRGYGEQDGMGRHGDEQDGGSFLGGIESGLSHIGSDIEGAAKTAGGWADKAADATEGFYHAHKDAIDTGLMIGAAVLMPGVGEAIDVAAGAAELGEAGATAAEAAEAAEGAEGAEGAAEGAAEGTDTEGFRTNRWSEEGATTDGEGAANEGASGNKPASADDFDPKTGKFKPKGSRSLLNLESNQVEDGAFKTTRSLGRAGKNLITGADDGATRAQAFRNLKTAAPLIGADLVQKTVGDDVDDAGKGPDGDGSDGGDGDDGGNGSDDDGGKAQRDLMRQQMEQMRQQQRQAADANAFAANSASLRHDDYINPF
jgi:hypothetical protein